MKISIIIPAHNEEDNIREVIDKIEDTLDIPYEIIVVNDHSSDNTPQVVRGLFARYQNIRLAENKLEKGFANALKTGFGLATTEAFIPVMADLCDELSTIKHIVDKIDEGYDLVCGSRYTKEGGRLGGSKIKGFFSFFVGRSLQRLIGLPTSDIANAFKLYRKKVIGNIVIQSKGFEISMEIPLKAYFLGYKITEVPTVWKERTKGKSNFNMLKLAPGYLKLYIWAIYKKLSGPALP